MVAGLERARCSAAGRLRGRLRRRRGRAEGAPRILRIAARQCARRTRARAGPRRRTRQCARTPFEASTVGRAYAQDGATATDRRFMPTMPRGTRPAARRIGVSSEVDRRCAATSLFDARSRGRPRSPQEERKPFLLVGSAVTGSSCSVSPRWSSRWRSASAPPSISGPARRVGDRADASAGSRRRGACRTGCTRATAPHRRRPFRRRSPSFRRPLSAGPAAHGVRRQPVAPAPAAPHPPHRRRLPRPQPRRRHLLHRR